ncbi:spheroidene monooxygenase [Rhodovulum imhoffii]|uniref:Spheroidene monooxygenase n=1 Tax=Rhodovulum imhoffii TaxID=365340 RepID=A0A2T5BSK6_9RHOB|nr:spheroidene monooxygenase [Rhodovulum imhoffii]MBK5933439.1 hypothetical protein [Rhodovulum imhoffii]PTN02324.1 spheroidene monooxygenase [Rhodovulum imhoffii]
MQVVTLSYFRYDNWASRFEAFTQMARARYALRNVEGLEFFKLMGTGSDAGFTPVPNVNVNAILAVWKDMETAKKAVHDNLTYRIWRDHSCEMWTLYMAATSARGRWSGAEPFTPQMKEKRGPLAVLTRATLKLPVALQFWKEVPDIQDMVKEDPDVVFKMGMAEVPWVQQVTFSIWPNAKVMNKFARGDCPHARAIQNVRDGNWFKEELYARFRILEDEGTWEGKSPLEKLKAEKTEEEAA